MALLVSNYEDFSYHQMTYYKDQPVQNLLLKPKMFRFRFHHHCTLKIKIHLIRNQFLEMQQIQHQLAMKL